MENKILEKVDKTIESICDYIQEDTKISIPDKSTTDMIKALAELISARRKLEREF